MLDYLAREAHLDAKDDFAQMLTIGIMLAAVLIAVIIILAQNAARR